MMAIQDIRKLAHEMIDKLEEKELEEVINKMRHMNNKVNKMANECGFPLVEPTVEEVDAIKKAKYEFENGESYTHEDVFGEDVYV
ncbi:hypothetical protein [Robertmurraya mangrovi]|nr:hypothetical protein [Bacillus sp. 31A1R]